MPTPTNRGAYGPYYEVLDRALESRNGIRVEFDSQGEAYQYRIRLHSARKQDSKLNRDARDRDDPYYGRSDYDSLIVCIREGDGKWWVYIEHTATLNNIEEIPA